MPATVLNIAKSASPEEDGPLPVETCPVKVELLIKDTTKTTENVETSGSDNTAEHVETNGIDNETEHVETCPSMPHVATSNTDQSVCTEDTEQPLTGVSTSKNDTYGCTAAIAPPPVRSLHRALVLKLVMTRLRQIPYLKLKRILAHKSRKNQIHLHLCNTVIMTQMMKRLMHTVRKNL